MANSNPSPATRFKPGQSGNPHGTRGPKRATLLKSLPAIRSLDEVMAEQRAWRGSMKQLFEAVARDPNNPLDIRLMAADRLLKTEGEAPPQLSSEQRQWRIRELLAADPSLLVIDGAAEVVALPAPSEQADA